MSGTILMVSRCEGISGRRDRSWEAFSALRTVVITLWPRERSTSIRVLARKPVPPVMRIWDILLTLLVDWMVEMVSVWYDEEELDGLRGYIYTAIRFSDFESRV